MLTDADFVTYIKSMKKDFLPSQVKMKLSETVINMMFNTYVIHHGYDLGGLLVI